MIFTQDIFPADQKPAKKILIGLLALVAFSLPFKFLVNLFIALAFITWFFTKPSFRQTPKFLRILIAILVFYLLHAVAFAYTTNIREGFFNLEIKLSFLFFPLIFFTTSFGWPQMKFFLRSFVLGNLLCCILCLGRAGYLTLTSDQNYFFYQNLSWFQHPSYLSMYLTFCCVVLMQKNIFSRTLNFLAVLFFTVFVLLLSSKTGIAIHFLFLLMAGVTYFLLKKRYAAVLSFTIAAGLLLSLLIYFVPPVKERFRNVVAAFSSEQVDKSATESTAVRMLIWGEARQIIREHPVMGVSPGDANDALYERYRENGLTGAYDKKLNAHNQYLQTGVGLGFTGLLSLLLVFMVPLFPAPRKLLVFFLLITAVNFLTESMLQTMAGCIFFSYFYALLSFDRHIEGKHLNSAI